VDCVTDAATFIQELIVQGHEVHWARDTAEARWLWMPNYFDSVLVCAEGASGFVARIKRECPHQNVEIVSPDELFARKKPLAKLTAFSPTPAPGGAPIRDSNVLHMPRRS
jgi:hypothetical protein